MHNREHVVVLRAGSSGMIAHTMFYPDEVRRIQEFRTDSANLNPRELELAKRLIDAMVVPFEPEKFRDSYRERLREMIDRKIAGQQVSREAAPSAASGGVIDIVQALQESLKAARKPPAPEQVSSTPSNRKPKSRKAG